MDKLNGIISELDKILKHSALLTKQPSRDVIDVAEFKDRKEHIGLMEELKTLLIDTVENLDHYLPIIKSIHYVEVDKIEMLSTNKKNPKKKEWNIVSRGRKYIKNNNHQLAQLESNNKSRINITNATYITAKVVLLFDQVAQDGELYYVSSADHFAVYISGLLLHGNIGNIFFNDKTVENVRDCRHKLNCIKKDKCDYYHDPLLFTGSKDHRNFMHYSWNYHPQSISSSAKTYNKKIGSRDNIDLDILAFNPEDIKVFKDQVMHDLLCCILVSEMCSA